MDVELLKAEMSGLTADADGTVKQSNTTALEIKRYEQENVRLRETLVR